MNLCGLLNSSLFSYFNLMLGSSTGIEREQIFLEELGNYPYVYNDELVELVEKMQREEWGKNRNELQVALNQCVMRMYGLQDNYFVDYALSIQIPMLCGTYQETKCDAKSMKEYVSILSKIWDEHFGQSNVHYKITIYPDIKGKFAAVQVKLSFTSQIEDIFVIDNVDEDVSLLTNFMIYQLNDCFIKRKML